MDGESISHEDWAEAAGRNVTTMAAFEAILAAAPFLGPVGAAAMVVGAGSMALGWFQNYAVKKMLESENAKHPELNKLQNSDNPSDREQYLAYMQYLSDWSEVASINMKGAGGDGGMEGGSLLPSPELSDYIKGGKKYETSINKTLASQMQKTIVNEVVIKHIQEYAEGLPGGWGAFVEGILPFTDPWTDQVVDNFSADLDLFMMTMPSKDIKLLEEFSGGKDKAKENMISMFSQYRKSDLEDLRKNYTGEQSNAQQPIKRNKGGSVPGPNVNKDIVPAMLTPGEFVLRRDAVDSIGLSTLYAMNEGIIPSPVELNTGGMVLPVTVQAQTPDTIEKQSKNVIDTTKYPNLTENQIKTINKNPDLFGKSMASILEEAVDDFSTTIISERSQKPNDKISFHIVEWGRYHNNIQTPSLVSSSSTVENDQLIKDTVEVTTPFIVETQKAKAIAEFYGYPDFFDREAGISIPKTTSKPYLFFTNYSKADLILDNMVSDYIKPYWRGLDNIPDHLEQDKSFKVIGRNAPSDIEQTIWKPVFKKDVGSMPTKRNKGGVISGSGPNKDTVPAMLTPGEFVLRRDAVKSIGLDALYAMNEGATLLPAQFSEGGLVENAYNENPIIKELNNELRNPESAEDKRFLLKMIETAIASILMEEAGLQNTQQQFRAHHLVDTNNNVINYDKRYASSTEQAQEQVKNAVKIANEMATSQAAIPNTSTPVSVTPLTPVQTPTTTSAEAVVPSQSQEEPIAAQPAEKTEEEKKIEISNLKDISESSFIVWQRTNEEMMKSIENGISDEEYKKRQEEVNNLSKQYEQNSKIYQDKIEEYSPKTETKAETRSFEEIMDSVYKIQKNTATGFEAILPPEQMRLDEPMKMPGTNWMTRLAGTNTSVTGNNTNISAIHDIGKTIANTVDERLYSAQTNNMVPRKAEPIMEYDSKKKPIRVALLEVHDTMNRLNSTIADMSANNQPTVVNNSTVVSAGGGGGGYPAYNSPRFTTAESDTINQMQAEYRKGAVV